MKRSLAIFLLLASLAYAAQAWAATLPDPCGDDKVKFDVATKKGQPDPAPPAAGNAQIVFIEAVDECGGCTIPPLRFGGEGAWSGANKGNSYFTVDVLPGEHHLCAAWQGTFGVSRQEPRWANFVALPDKVYYFEARVTIVSRLSGVGIDARIEVDGTVNFLQVSEEEGKRRVKASALSISKRKK
jgi:hypothetical protein